MVFIDVCNFFNIVISYNPITINTTVYNSFYSNMVIIRKEIEI